MTNPWFDAQKKILESWSSAMQTPFSMNGAPNGAANGSAFWQNPWAYWQNMMQNSMAPMASPGLMGEAWAETARATAERMVASQTQMMQLLQQVTDAWQTLAASAMNGEDWQATLTAYTESLHQQWQSAAEQTLALNTSSGELWRTYLQGLQAAGQPWAQAWTTTLMQWPAQMGAAVNGGSSFSGLPDAATFMAPYWEAMETTLGQSLNTPPLGLTREYTHLLNTAFQAWLENRRAEFEYQSLINEGWVDTFEALMRRLVADAQAGNAVQTPRGLTDLWVEVGDDVFTELFRGERYATAQAALVNSNMTLKLKQRELLERWLASNDMPTRSEVDEAHRVIHDLRKEVKALRRQLAQAAETAPTIEALEQKLAAIEERQTQVEKDVKEQASTASTKSSQAKSSRAKSSTSKASTSKTGATKPKRRTRKSATASGASGKDSTAQGSKTAAAEGDEIQANDADQETGEK